MWHYAVLILSLCLFNALRNRQTIYMIYKTVVFNFKRSCNHSQVILLSISEQSTMLCRREFKINQHKKVLWIESRKKLVTGTNAYFTWLIACFFLFHQLDLSNFMYISYKLLVQSRLLMPAFNWTKSVKHNQTYLEITFYLVFKAFKILVIKTH